MNRTARAHRAAVVAIAILAALLLTRCADGSDAVLPAQPDVLASATPATERPTQDPTLQPEPNAPRPPSNSEDAPSSPEPAATAVAPAIRVPENPGTLDETNWIARNFMDAESVDLVWSEVEQADVYRVYRIPTRAADYDAIQAGDLATATLVYEGSELRFIDRTMEAGVFLTYVLVAQVGGDLTAPRWTEALTVDDTTPPTPITGLIARNAPDGVLIEWQPSTDDVEFASYSVSVVVDDQLQYIGGGADETLTSFLDTDTSPGTRIYVVAAVDFHNNRSESAQVEITR